MNGQEDRAIVADGLTIEKKEILTIYCLNAQSLLCHFNVIELMIKELDIDILCVCETWLDSFIEDRFLKVLNFNVIRCDAGRGGGVCIYVRSDLKVSVIDTGIDRFEKIEDLYIQVQHRSFPSIIIGCRPIYRHPRALAASFSYLNDVFSVLLLRNKPIFIFGDLNDDQLAKDNNLSKVVKSLNLFQVIDKPTRITSNFSTLLDVVIANKPNMIVKSDVAPSPVTDHELISICVNIRKPKCKPQIRTYRCRKNYSQNAFCELLLNEINSLNSILNTDDVNKQVEIFTNTFNGCLDQCAPVVTKEITRPFAPWIDQDLKNIISEKNSLQLRLKNDRSNHILGNQFKEKKKNVEKLLDTAKRSHFKEKFNKSKGNGRATWKTAGEMIPGLKNKKQMSFNDPPKKAEEFNIFFASIGEAAFKQSQEGAQNNGYHYGSGNNANGNLPTISHLFRPQPIDVNTVVLVFKDLNDTNAFGSDGIPLRYLRDALPVLMFYIVIIINMSIVTSICSTLEISTCSALLQKWRCRRCSQLSPNFFVTNFI